MDTKERILRKEAIKGRGLSWDGISENPDKADDLVRQYKWDAVTIGQKQENEKIKEKLKSLGVTKISNSGIKSFGRIEIDL